MYFICNTLCIDYDTFTGYILAQYNNSTKKIDKFLSAKVITNDGYTDYDAKRYDHAFIEHTGNDHVLYLISNHYKDIQPLTITDITDIYKSNILDCPCYQLFSRKDTDLNNNIKWSLYDFCACAYKVQDLSDKIGLWVKDYLTKIPQTSTLRIFSDIIADNDQVSGDYLSYVSNDFANTDLAKSVMYLGNKITGF